MKKFFLTAVALSVLLLIGCQENSITNSVKDVGQQAIPKSDDPLVNQGIIELDGILEVPGLTTSFLEISGQVEFVHELVLVDPIPPASQYYVSLSFQLNAELSDPYSENHQDFTISSESQDLIYVSEDGIYLLEKSFAVQGRRDGLILLCRFLVTTDGVGLNEMWLVIPEGNSNS
jgi:hypothetical protein